MPALAEGYDHVIIDGPPQVADVTRSAIMASRPRADPGAAVAARCLGRPGRGGVAGRGSHDEASLKSAFAVSRKIVNTAIGRDVADALAVYRMRVLAASLAQRVSFAEALATGQTVLETDPAGSASAEVAELTREILEIASGKESADRPSEGSHDP